VTRGGIECPSATTLLVRDHNRYISLDPGATQFRHLEYPHFASIGALGGGSVSAVATDHEPKSPSYRAPCPHREEAEVVLIEHLIAAIVELEAREG
jgi:hypothetical protein